MKSKHTFLLALQLHIVAANKLNETPEYLSITTEGENPASFTTSQRFEQTVLSEEDHRRP